MPNIMKAIMALLGDFGKELVVEMGSDLILRGGGTQRQEISGNAGAKIGQAVSMRVKKSEEYRDELLAFIGTELPKHGEDAEKASENLLLWHTKRCKNRSTGKYGRIGSSLKRYQPGDEDFFVNALGSLYESLSDEHEHELRIETFEWLGSLEEPDFNNKLEFLHNDVLRQWFLRAVRLLNMMGAELKKWLSFVVEKMQSMLSYVEEKIPEPDSVEQFVRNMDTTTTNGLRRFNAWLENKVGA